MKILLIEDDQHTRELLLATLSAHRYAVDTIADGSMGLEMATQWDYDLILLDILIPTLNGIEVCRRLRIQGCQTPILMLTMKDSNEDVIAGLDAGADDYVAKSCDSSQLLARVRALLRRAGGAPPSPVLTWEHLCFDPALARVTYSQKEVALRPKEYSLLELFLRHPQRIFSRSAIIDHLWSIEETPVEGSVTTLIKDLRQRLKSAGMEADLIETVYGLGYRLKTAPIETGKISKHEDTKSTNIEETLTKSPPTEAGIVPEPVLPRDWDRDWAVREQRGLREIQQITERFQVSLKQRMSVLEAAARSLQAGDFSGQQQQAVRTEVHKLAGGLGTFGCGKASDIAQSIERLLDHPSSQETRLAHQFSQLLEELKQELAQPITQERMTPSNIVRR